MLAIIAKNVVKSFIVDVKNTRKVVLNNISLQVEAGQTVLLVGANGAGKSTLVRLLLGLMRPDSGTIEIDGADPALPASRARLAYVPEVPALFPWATAQQHLNYFAQLKGMAPERVVNLSQQWMQQLNLRPEDQQTVHTYSKGMRQKLALTIALMQAPRCLILDEPLSGLDPLSRHNIIAVLEKLQQQQVTLFICSHILTDMQKLAPQALLLNQQVIQATWTRTALDLEAWFIAELQKTGASMT